MDVVTLRKLRATDILHGRARAVRPLCCGFQLRTCRDRQISTTIITFRDLIPVDPLAKYPVSSKLMA